MQEGGREGSAYFLFTLAATQGGNELTSKRECSGIVKRVCAPCMSYQTHIPRAAPNGLLETYWSRLARRLYVYRDTLPPKNITPFDICTVAVLKQQIRT